MCNTQYTVIDKDNPYGIDLIELMSFIIDLILKRVLIPLAVAADKKHNAAVYGTIPFFTGAVPDPFVLDMVNIAGTNLY